MNWRANRSALLVVTLASAGCARGCEGPPAVAATAPLPVDVTRAPAHPAAAVEAQYALQLPERHSSEVLPGWPSLPYRRLLEFKPEQHLVVAVAASGVQVLERKLGPERLSQDADITAALRWALGEWQRRSGVAANRVVLAIDKDAPPDVVNRVRNVALQAALWRVVGLSRDEDRLVELLLSPPPDRRPNGAPMPTAASATNP